MHLLLWSGPVSAANVAGAALPADSRLLVVNQGIDAKNPIGSTAFANVGRKYETLRAFCSARGVDVGQFDTVSLAGFSAAHGLLELLLRDEDSAGRTTALLAFDAYYTSSALRVKPGYRAFCERAVRGRALCVLSSSTFAGQNYPSCDRAVRELVRDLPLVESQCPARLRAALSAAGLQLPLQTLIAGGLIWLRYGETLKHAEHATRLASPVLTSLLTPYLTAQAAAGDDSVDLLTLVLTAILATELMAV